MIHYSYLIIYFPLTLIFFTYKYSPYLTTTRHQELIKYMWQFSSSNADIDHDSIWKFYSKTCSIALNWVFANNSKGMLPRKFHCCNLEDYDQLLFMSLFFVIFTTSNLQTSPSPNHRQREDHKPSSWPPSPPKTTSTPPLRHLPPSSKSCNNPSGLQPSTSRPPLPSSSSSSYPPPYSS